MLKNDLLELLSKVDGNPDVVIQGYSRWQVISINIVRFFEPSRVYTSPVILLSSEGVSHAAG